MPSGGVQLLIRQKESSQASLNNTHKESIIWTVSRHLFRHKVLNVTLFPEAVSSENSKFLTNIFPIYVKELKIIITKKYCLVN